MDFITTNKKRAKAPKAGNPRVIVIGAGVIGLSTAWALLDRGYEVTILAERYYHLDGDRLASQAAGALWEYPPAVCGHQTNEIALEYSKRWSMISYRLLRNWASNPMLSEAFGVKMRRAVFFFDQRVDEDEHMRHKKDELEASGVSEFRHDDDLLEEEKGHVLWQDTELVDAYSIMAPTIDTDRAMSFMHNLVRAKGAKFVERSIDRNLVDIEAELLLEYNAKAIVNAAGLGARVTADDPTVHPLRGAVLRLQNDNTKFPKVEDCYIVSAQDVGRNETSKFTFIVPRSNNILIVGGFSEPDNYNLDLHTESPLVRDLKRRAGEFIQGGSLNLEHIDTAYPLAQGLRPARDDGVRVERELITKVPGQAYSRIIHSYGHAGSGWSLSFGCALHVAMLVGQAIGQKVKPEEMRLEGARILDEKLQTYLSVDKSPPASAKGTAGKVLDCDASETASIRSNSVANSEDGTPSEEAVGRTQLVREMGGYR